MLESYVFSSKEYFSESISCFNIYLDNFEVLFTDTRIKIDAEELKKKSL